MKIEIDKLYVTKGGHVIGPLQSSELPLRGTDPPLYPFWDCVNHRLYNQDGTPLIGEDNNRITAAYCEPKPKEAKPMNMELGKQYVTASGKITNPLEPCSIPNYPFRERDGYNVYTKDGKCGHDHKKDNIVSLYHGPCKDVKITYEGQTVIIDLEKYNRFVAMEKSLKRIRKELKEIYTEAKKQL